MVKKLLCIALVIGAYIIANADFDYNPRMRKLSQQEINENKTPEAVAYNFTQALTARDAKGIERNITPRRWERINDQEWDNAPQSVIDTLHNIFRFITNTPTPNAGYGLKVGKMLEDYVTAYAPDSVGEVEEVIVEEWDGDYDQYPDSVAVEWDGDYDQYPDSVAVVDMGEEFDYTPGDTIGRKAVVVLMWTPDGEAGISEYRKLSRYDGNAMLIALDEIDGAWRVDEFMDLAIMEKQSGIEDSTKVFVCNGEKISHPDPDCKELGDCEEGSMITYGKAKSRGYSNCLNCQYYNSVEYAEELPEAPAVYISDSDIHYHIDPDCPAMKNGGVFMVMDIDEADSEGYQMCEECFGVVETAE